MCVCLRFFLCVHVGKWRVQKDMALGQRAKGHLAIVLLGFWHVNVFGYALVLHVECVFVGDALV